MRSLLVVDDDELSRDVLMLLAAEAGFVCAAAESGVAALELLGGGGTVPDVVLTDVQMPGLTGESLARLLRVACGPATALLAMSGSDPGAAALRGFDGFLPKPFSMAALEATLDGLAPPIPVPTTVVALDERVYRNLAAHMPESQLWALYTLCLDDAEKRLHTMEAAARARDDKAFRAAAHATKGGCAMVGAAELAALAGEMEAGGLPEVDNEAPFVELMSAIDHLRRMLDARRK